MTGPLLALALAAAPELLLPPWPLSRDGEPVGVRGGAPLEADGATVEPIAPGLARVVPSAGAARITLRAGGATATAEVEPPPGTVEIAVSPAAPVKGRDPSAELRIEVRRADGQPDPDAGRPELVASSGTVRDLAAAGPGRWRATFVPADTIHPEVAVLLAIVPRCPLCATPRAVGDAIVPLAAAIELPGRAEPGTRTRVTVAGRTFGPATADARGRFAVPIVVPPGAHSAEADSVDPTGNRRTTRLDLRLPEVDRLACAAWPAALPADGESGASLWCVASSVDGAPAAGARLLAEASAGVLGPFEPVRGALQRARFRAPAGGGGTEVALATRYPDGGAASRDASRVRLATGAPAQIVATLAREPVPFGAAVAAETAVLDAHGDRIGVPHGPEGARDGFVAPDRFVALAGGASEQAAPLAFALAPGREAATLALRPGPEAWIAEARTVDARPAEGVRLRFGGGAEAVTDARGEARVPASARESVTGPGGVRAAGFEGVSPPPRPFELARTIRVPLRPPAPVDVVARVDGRTVRWRVEDPAGRALPGREVAVRAGQVQLGPAERDGDGGRASIRGGRGAVAIVDVATGVAAVVEVE